MSATQMNFRIDADVKASGNMALSESAITPSQLVHAVWEYLARNRHVPNAARKLLDFLASDGAHADTGAATDRTDPDGLATAPASEVMAGPLLIDQFYSELGIEKPKASSKSIEELKREAYEEKFAGIGATL